jgi:hypothetical protein
MVLITIKKATKIYLNGVGKNHLNKPAIDLQFLYGVLIESPEGTSPSGSHRTVLETLASHGSSCPLLTPWPAS